MTGLQITKSRRPSLWGLLVQRLQHCKENYQREIWGLEL